MAYFKSLKTSQVALVITIFSCLFASIFWTNFKSARLFCEVTIWGTVHSQHTQKDVYPLNILSSAIATLKPTALFLEISKKDLLANDWSSAPPEMVLLYLQAKRLQIPVYGFSEDPDEDSTNEQEPSAQLKKLRQFLIRSIGGYSFAKVNSPEAIKTLQIYNDIRNKEISESSPQRRREIAMNQNLRQLLKTQTPERVFVFTGFTHLYHLQEATKDICQIKSALDTEKSISLVELNKDDLTAAQKIWQKTLQNLQQEKAPERKIKRIESFLSFAKEIQ